MNWVRELLDLYEKNHHLVGVVEKGRFKEDVILLPPFHTTVKAQITVRISPGGDFLGAVKTDKNDSLTVIPVTEESASRTSGIAPHPLCDNLSYIAGNYNDYAPERDKEADKKHRLYLDGIKKWAESPYSHEKVRAVYAYAMREHTIEDLISVGVLTAGDDGKISDIKQFLRFSVEGKWKENAAPCECWLDDTLRDAYVEYVKSEVSECGLSYLSGEVVPISYLQPKKIRNEGDGAKLISANDSSGYTYRGRFATKEEAFAIGYEESQNIHNALKWIIRRQGKSYGGLTVVVWESELLPIPDFDASADDICSVDDFFAVESENDTEDSHPNAVSAARFISAIDGYRKKVSYDSNVILMVLNAATPGRLSVIEASSLPTSDYLCNIEKWHRDCELYHISRSKDKHLYSGMVSIKDIADMLYDDDKLLPTVFNRLRSCIISGRPLPTDIVDRAVHKASSPVSYEYEIEWERVLSLAASMVKKKRIEKGEKWTMSLNKDSKNRSYLFGRLLAVADRIEFRTYSEGARQTNAKRYMNMFSQRPSRTWQIIAERIEPYIQKLKAGEMLYYSHLIEEICQSFDENDFADNTPLDGLYLLGYYHQSHELKNKTDKNESETTENE